MLTDALPIRPLLLALLPALNPLPNVFHFFAAYMPRTSAPRRTQLSALETILVDHYADAATATVLKTAHHSPAAINLHVRLRSHNVGGKRQCEIHSRTDGDIHIHAK